MQAAIPYNYVVSEFQNYLPPSLRIGKMWLHPKLFDECKKLKSPFDDTPVMNAMLLEQKLYNQRICNIFGEELVICLEKLRLLRLENVEVAGAISDYFER